MKDENALKDAPPDDGRTLDHKTLEAIRIRAVKAVLRGHSTPQDWGYGTALWTRGILAELIEQSYRIQLSEATVGRCLHKLGFQRAGAKLEC